MNDNLTEIIFVLDRSGSMRDLTQDTIGGFNSFIETQKQEPGEAKLTTVLFDDRYEILHNGIDLKDIEDLTVKEYYARGMTALLDAIGKTINIVGERLNNIKENDCPSKIIFVITTDGYENSSKEFTQDVIKEMIEHQTDKYNWQFIFLGANMDAISVAGSYGISAAASYTATPIGTQNLYDTVSSTTTSYRASGKINKDWDKEL